MTHVRTLALRQVLQSPSSIPSPHQGVWQVGPFPVRAYALCILAGIVVALVVTNRRWRPRGGAGVVLDIAMWAVPFGIVGGRTYHVITDPELYFLPGRNPWNALKIWEGGLGIWGAVALGAVGAWIGARRAGVPLSRFADAAAPAIPVAQAFGRWGNWFNQELLRLMPARPAGPGGSVAHPLLGIGSQRVVDPPAAPARGDQPRLAQYLQVIAQQVARDRDLILNFAHTHRGASANRANTDHRAGSATACNTTTGCIT